MPVECITAADDVAAAGNSRADNRFSSVNSITRHFPAYLVKLGRQPGPSVLLSSRRALHVGFHRRPTRLQSGD